jgi:hypothetical protein
MNETVVFVATYPLGQGSRLLRRHPNSQMSASLAKHDFQI